LEQNLSIIIPTYNEEKNIGRVLLQLTSQLEAGDEIIIVDSRSSDRTAQIAKSFGARVLSMGKEGIGLARTLGARGAKNAVIAFLDCDVQLCEGWARKVKSHFRDPELEAVGGLDLYTYGNAIEDLMYNTYSRSVFALGALTHALLGNFWVPSNNGAFRKDVFLKVGGYRAFLCEDFEFTKRFRPKKAFYDYSLVAFLSDRRFKKDGFFRTVLLWVISDLEALFGMEKKGKAAGYKSS